MFEEPMKRIALALGLVSLASALALAQPAASGGNWPHFRGPTLNAAVADDPDLPETWSRTENVEWATGIPGLVEPRGLGQPGVSDDGHGRRGLRIAQGRTLRAARAPGAAADRPRLAGLLPRPGDGEQGDTYVIRAGREYELLGVNSLDEMAMASPAIAGDRLLIRTASRLYSIRKQQD